MTSFLDRRIPVILFGAFDRHNFGDLLFPHIISALLPGHELIFAGLRKIDMRAYGGHQINALPQLVRDLKHKPVNIIHVGGELLTCNEWQAAIMLLSPEKVQETISLYGVDANLRHLWACNYLGMQTLAPYCVSHDMFPLVNKIIYNAIGGVDFDFCNAAMRAEVITKLTTADAVSVRDEVTESHLLKAQIKSVLLPDSVFMIAELFKDKILQRGGKYPLVQILELFPEGYIAVQFSADFGDDETLDVIADELDRVVENTGLNIVFFRAGAAPWHDDLDCYKRTAERMRKPGYIFYSLNIWDICALISHSRIYCGSSLHGRIVAMAFALPRINLIHMNHKKSILKQTAFANTWEQVDMPVVTTVNNIYDEIHLAMASNEENRKQLAENLAIQYRQGVGAIFDLVH